MQDIHLHIRLSQDIRILQDNLIHTHLLLTQQGTQQVMLEVTQTQLVQQEEVHNHLIDNH